MSEQFEDGAEIIAPWGMCKEKCGRPRNKWTVYCNECYNRRKKERYAESQAKRFVAENTPASNIPVELLQATVNASQEELIRIQLVLQEKDADIERLCTHLEDYRPDRSDYFRKKNGLTGSV
jgi:hypothetical protein